MFVYMKFRSLLINLEISNIFNYSTIFITNRRLTMSTDGKEPKGDIPTTQDSKVAKPPRFHPYSKPNPILLSGDRRSRKRKSLTWQSEEKIQKVHFFEYIADERVNVTKVNTDQQSDPNASANSVTAGSSLNANNKVLNAVGNKILNDASVDAADRTNSKTESDKVVDYMPWRPLVLIDLPPELPSPGWQSIERSTQAERESYVLGAIDLPGQPSTLDEPDVDSKTSQSGAGSGGTSSGGVTNEMGTKDGATGEEIKIIPAVNPEGMFTEYTHMYNGEFVNGVKITPDNSSQSVAQNILALCNQQSQILPNPFQQQQLVHATQNPFNFQDMVAQFQLQAQMQIQFPFQQQQQ